MYDVITSLGYNCEISFRIEHYFGELNAMLFSWSYEMDRDLFIEALENIDDIFSGKVTLLEDQMICDERYLIKFHPRYEVLRRFGKPTEETFEECVKELRSRTSHLKEKFKNLLTSNQSTLFIMKVEDKGEEDNINFIKKVEDVLQRKYVSGNFTLAVVLEESAMTEKIKELENSYDSSHLKICSVKKFAPRKHTDIMGDTSGWKKIIYELTSVKDSGYNKRLFRRRVHWFFSAVEYKLAKMFH